MRTNVRAASQFTLPQFFESLGALLRVASVLLSLYWVTIFVGTHLPSSAVPRLHLSDKVFHVGAFAGLAFLLAWAIPKTIRGMTHHFLIVAAIGCGYAILDEWTQLFVPGRVSDLYDCIADFIGVALGFAVYVVLRWTCQRINILQRLVLALSR